MPDQPPTPGQQRRVVVARIPDVTAGTKGTTMGPTRYRFDQVDQATKPLPSLGNRPNEPEPHVEATPLTRDWYRLAGGLAISVLLLYLAVHSLFEMKRVQKNVNAGVVADDPDIQFAETVHASPAATTNTSPNPAGMVAPTSPQFISNPVAADESKSMPLMLTDTDVIQFPSGQQPVDGGTDPIESTYSIGQGLRSTPSAEPSSTDQSSTFDSTSIDPAETADYPGTGYPSLQRPVADQAAEHAGEPRVRTPLATARLQGSIEKYTE